MGSSPRKRSNHLWPLLNSFERAVIEPLDAVYVTSAASGTVDRFRAVRSSGIMSISCYFGNYGVPLMPRFAYKPRLA
jgi:hypothetical protein